MLLSLRGLGSDNQPEYEEDFDRVNPSAMVRMGYLVQEPSGGYSRRDNFSNKSGADEDSRMVRGRAGASLEASFPHNIEKHQVRESSIGTQCVVSHAQSVVEISHGHSKGLVGKGGGAEQAKEAICYAPLGQIQVDHSREEACRF